MNHTSHLEVIKQAEQRRPIDKWRGDAWFYTLRSGVKIRGSRTKYLQNIDNSAVIPPQVGFVFLLEGTMTLILDKQKHVFRAGEQGCCIMISLMDAHVLRRIATAGETNDHVVLSGMEKWVEGDSIASGLTRELYGECIRSWPMTLAMREGCREWRELKHDVGDLQKDLLGLSLLNAAWKHFLWWRKSTVLSNVTGHRHVDLKLSLETLTAKGIFDSQRLADQLNMSLRTLQRRANEQLECTLKDWVTQRRLLLAREAMIERNVSITEAACVAGYQHTSSFIQAFRKAFGMTPKSYLMRLVHRSILEPTEISHSTSLQKLELS